MRLFVALSLPDEVALSLLALQAGVPGANWRTREQLHLTLRFIGEVDGRDAAAIDDALATISAPAFSLELKGVGEFGGRHPHTLWTGTRGNEAILHLQRKIESALQRIGLESEGRKYTPHVVVGRLKASPQGRVIDYLREHALYASVPFEVVSFVLFSSKLASSGAIHRPERTYMLSRRICTENTKTN